LHQIAALSLQFDAKHDLDELSAFSIMVLTGEPIEFSTFVSGPNYFQVFLKS